MYRLVPLLVGGAIVLMLLPAPPPPAGGTTAPGINLASAAPVEAAAPTAPKPTDVSVTLAREDIGSATASSAAPLGTSPDWPQLAPNGSPAAAGTAAPDPSTLKSDRVGNSAVNVRSDPSAASDKLFVLAPGEDVKVAETDRGWAHIYRADGQSGWVYSRYLAGGEPAAPPPDASVATNTPRPPAAAPSDNSDSLRGRFARIGADMPVRAAPQNRAPMLFMLDAGERVRISQSRGRWLQVVTEDGDSGWIPS
jgi:SH3-like domain-containing protein